MKDLGLKSITRRKYYKKVKNNEIFPSLLNQNFSDFRLNEKCCTGFTCLQLSTGKKLYNCSILDLYDRSIIVSVAAEKIDSDLAIKTLKIALNIVRYRSRIILHSDQGSKFASKKFTNFCKTNAVVQSMSRSGCSYDNSSMERFFIRLKLNFLIYIISVLNKFQSVALTILSLTDIIFAGDIHPIKKRFLFKLALFSSLRYNFSGAEHFMDNITLILPTSFQQLFTR